MGGCASKPKGLKADIDVAPAPAPAKEESHTVSETKIDGETKEIVGEVKKIEEGQEGKVDEGEEKAVVKVEEESELDEHGNKRRSLSHLFKENEGNKPTADDKTQNETVTLEPVKEVEPKSENATKESNTIVPEIENATKENFAPIADVPKTVATEKPIEVAPSVETVNLEKSEEKKTQEEETEKPTEVAQPVEIEKLENSKETGVAATPVAVETEKTIEVAPTVETVKLEKSEETETKEVVGPVDVAQPVQTEKLEDSMKVKTEVEGKGVIAENVEVTEKVPDVDVRQEEPVLPVSSAKEVAGEVVPEAK